MEMGDFICERRRSSTDMKEGVPSGEETISSRERCTSTFGGPILPLGSSSSSSLDDCHLLAAGRREAKDWGSGWAIVGEGFLVVVGFEVRFVEESEGIACIELSFSLL